MWNGVEHWRNVTWRSHPLQLPLCVFISCSVPAGSGPGLDACPDSPLWRSIISLERRRKVTRWSLNHQRIMLLMSCRFILLYGSVKQCPLQNSTGHFFFFFYWTDVLHITILVKLCHMQKKFNHTAVPFMHKLLTVVCLKTVSTLQHGLFKGLACYTVGSFVVLDATLCKYCICTYFMDTREYIIETIKKKLDLQTKECFKGSKGIANCIDSHQNQSKSLTLSHINLLIITECMAMRTM